MQTAAHKLLELFAGSRENTAEYIISRGFSAWGGKKYDRSSFTIDWRPAIAFNENGQCWRRRLTAREITHHVRGRHDVGIVLRSELAHFALLDVDAHPTDDTPEAQCRAEASAHGLLEALWEEFDFDNRPPVVLRSPRGGFHIYLPFAAPAPAEAVREALLARLRQAGIGSGVDVWPCKRGLRLPCGRGMAILEHVPGQGALAFRFVHARWKTRSGNVSIHRNVERQLPEFIARFEAARRDVSEWVELGKTTSGRSLSGAHKAGKYRSETESPHNVDISGGRRGATSSPSPFEVPTGIQHDGSFMQTVKDLLEKGIPHEGARHSAVIKLCWYWVVVEKKSKEVALWNLRKWLNSNRHLSVTLVTNERKFLRDSLREADQYIDRHCLPCVDQHQQEAFEGVRRSAERELSSAEREVLEGKIDPAVLSEACSILRYVSGYADSKGRVEEPFRLSKNILDRLCGDRRIKGEDGTRRRRSVLALEELVKLGILQLYRNYSTGNHARFFTCWYQFGSAQLPGERDDGELTLATREIDKGRLEVITSRQGPTLADIRDLPLKLKRWAEELFAGAFTPREFRLAEPNAVLPGPGRQIELLSEMNDPEQLQGPSPCCIALQWDTS